MQTKEERDSALGAAAVPSSDPKAILSDDPTQIIVQGPDGRLIDWESRKGFGQQILSLAYPERPGFHRHWFNDEPGRIAYVQSGGYTPVLDDQGKPVTRVVDKGTGMLAYLHEIPEAWYKADLAEGQKRADEIDRQVRVGNAPGTEKLGIAGEKGFYGAVKMSRQAKG